MINVPLRWRSVLKRNCNGDLMTLKIPLFISFVSIDLQNWVIIFTQVNLTKNHDFWYKVSVLGWGGFSAISELVFQTKNYSWDPFWFFYLTTGCYYCGKRWRQEIIGGCFLISHQMNQHLCIIYASVKETDCRKTNSFPTFRLFHPCFKERFQDWPIRNYL